MFLIMKSMNTFNVLNKTFSDDCVISYDPSVESLKVAQNEETLKKIYKPFNPDQVVYCKPYPLYIEDENTISEKVKEYKEKIDCPTFILGDFNAEPDTETITYLKEYNGGEYVDLSGDIEYTYHGFHDSATPDSGCVKEPCKIDYIFVDRETSKKPHSVTLWDDKVNGILLSDHYPVCLEIEM